MTSEMNNVANPVAKVINILYPCHPPTKYPTPQAKATVNAYGICVVTCSIWSQSAPVEERMVVSDIGEQWSPNTLPPKVAANDIVIKSGVSEREGSHIRITMGTRIPNVPQAVPMEKDRNAATIKIITGRSHIGKCPCLTRSLMNFPVLSKSLQTPLIVHASTSIVIAGIIS